MRWELHSQGESTEEVSESMRSVGASWPRVRVEGRGDRREKIGLMGCFVLFLDGVQ